MDRCARKNNFQILLLFAKEMAVLSVFFGGNKAWTFKG